MNKYVPGSGPIGAKLVIVGEAPSYEEVNQGRAFVGPSGRELDKILKDSDIKRDECWITNVCKYFVSPNVGDKKIPFQTRARADGINLEEQINDLRTELNEVSPNCILALGGTALWALTGKSKIGLYRGSILPGITGRKVVGTYHPAHLLHQQGEIKGYWNRQVMIFDFKRAYQQSQFKEFKLPHRNLQVCRSSAQLADFIHRNKNETKLSLDIEALHCIPTCIGLAFNSHEGLSVPLWNCNSISSIPDSDLISIWILLGKLLHDKSYKKIGQNFGYDRDKIKRLGFVIDRLHSDTMLKAFVINPELPKNLAFNTSIYTEEPYYKDEGSEFDASKQSIDDLFLYNAKDSCVTHEIDTAMDADLDELELRPFYENFVMKLHALYQYIESEGMRIDHNIRERLIRKYVEWDEQIGYELFQLAGDYINTGSPKQVASLLYDNWKIPLRKGTGEEVLTQLLNNTVKRPDYRKGIELILTDRRVRKTIDTYLLTPPDFDGRMRTSYFICLETGRTSTNQQEPPIRPMTEYEKKKKRATGMAFQTITKHGDIGADIREMFIADEGEIFIQADSSQAEARVVALLADDEEMLKMYDEHDIHALTASWFFGGSEDDYSKRKLGYESPYRFAGKTLRHAGHLGAGKKRAAIELNTQARKAKIDFQLSEAMAEKALKIFHQRAPKIQQVFHAGIVRQLGINRQLVAPIPYGINSPTGGKRTFFERWGDELFRQAFAYIPQRAVTDNTKATALRLFEMKIPWLRILLESHDSLLFSVPTDKVGEAIPIIKREFERPINFSRCSLPRHELVIPCEVEIGKDYKNLNKC